MTGVGDSAFLQILTQAQGYGSASVCPQYGYTAALQDVLLTNCPTSTRVAARVTCLCSNDDAKISSLITRNAHSRGCGDVGALIACEIYENLCTMATDIESTLSLGSF